MKNAKGVAEVYIELLEYVDCLDGDTLSNDGVTALPIVKKQITQLYIKAMQKVTPTL